MRAYASERAVGPGARAAECHAVPAKLPCTCIGPRRRRSCSSPPPAPAPRRLFPARRSRRAGVRSERAVGAKRERLGCRGANATAYSARWGGVLCDLPGSAANWRSGRKTGRVHHPASVHQGHRSALLCDLHRNARNRNRRAAERAGVGGDHETNRRPSRAARMDSGLHQMSMSPCARSSGSGVYSGECIRPFSTMNSIPRLSRVGALAVSRPAQPAIPDGFGRLRTETNAWPGLKLTQYLTRARSWLT